MHRVFNSLQVGYLTVRKCNRLVRMQIFRNLFYCIMHRKLGLVHKYWARDGQHFWLRANLASILRRLNERNIELTSNIRGSQY